MNFFDKDIFFTKCIFEFNLVFKLFKNIVFEKKQSHYNLYTFNMAERRVSAMLCQNAGNTNINHRLNNFLAFDSCTELFNMFYDGVRLKWLDDLENVKRIVCQVWGLGGKWSSPGG